MEPVLFYDTDKLLNSFIHLVKFLPIVGAAEGTTISHLSFVQILHTAQAKGVAAFKIDGMDHQLQTNGAGKFLGIKACLKPLIAHFLVLLSVGHLLLLIFFTQKRSEVILGDTLQPCLVDLLPLCFFSLLNVIVSIGVGIPSTCPHL